MINTGGQADKTPLVFQKIEISMWIVAIMLLSVLGKAIPSWNDALNGVQWLVIMWVLITRLWNR